MKIEKSERDILVQLFCHSMVYDGDHSCKKTRDIFIKRGWAERKEAYTALTCHGKFIALLAWPMPLFWLKSWWNGDLSATCRYEVWAALWDSTRPKPHQLLQKMQRLKGVSHVSD